MQRTVITPADLSGAALADLKGWLGISRPNEDELLTTLLAASLAMCEGFTGQSPIEQTVEERVAARSRWHCLTARPVRAVEAVEAIALDGTRAALTPDDYTVQIEANGTARIEIRPAGETHQVAVSVRTGIGSDWSALPAPLKQGIIRLAAFNYRDRETGRDAMPPASVTALWRPWRVVRLT